MKKSFQQARRRAAEGVVYKHDLGQHFLYDEALLRSLVAATGVSREDGVLEIGPGAGTLTRCLCEAAGRVVAVEVDRDVLPFLRAATDAFDNLTIVEGDVRRLDLDEICRPLGEGLFVIANIGTAACPSGRFPSWCKRRSRTSCLPRLPRPPMA